MRTIFVSLLLALATVTVVRFLNLNIDPLLAVGLVVIGGLVEGAVTHGTTIYRRRY